MRKSDDFHYTWKLEWDESCYRGWYHFITFRDWWWVPITITAGPLTPAFLAMIIYWLLKL